MAPVEAVCRICDRRISGAIMLKHSKHCRVVHSCAAVIEHCNEKLATIITTIERRMSKLGSQQSSPLPIAMETLYEPLQSVAPPKMISTTFPSSSEAGFGNDDDVVLRALTTLVQRALDLPVEPSPTFLETVSDIHKRLIALESGFESFCGLLVASTLEALSDKSDSIDRMNEILREHPDLLILPGEVSLPTIEDFDIHKTLSRGAFGEVFLARKKSTLDYFAVKVLKKKDLVRKNQVKHVMNERKMMAMINSPYVVQLFYSFQTVDSLYMVMEYATGGDVHMLLQSVGTLTESWARFYIAEVVLALEHIHSLGVVHRDIKPDNLLITATGHIKLADFGLSRDGMAACRVVSDPPLSTSIPSTQAPNANRPSRLATRKSLLVERYKSKSALYSYVGTPDYIAPEVILGTGHDTALDWWTTGVCLYEFLVGLPPFFEGSVEATYMQILTRNLEWEENMSLQSIDLIDKLLTVDPNKRLGARGAGEVKSHPFFKDIDWNNLAHTSPSYVPLRNLSIQSLPTMFSRDEDGSFISISADTDLSTFDADKGSKDHELDENAPDPDRFLPFHFKNLKLLEDVNKRLFEQATNALPTESLVDEDKPTPLAAIDIDARVILCLVCEDNPVTQLLVKALMKQVGITITQAYTGTEAVHHACEQKFDMIFMDIMMPEMEGTEATAIIRKNSASQNHDTPIIAFTALSDWNINQYNKDGMNDLLAKPFTKDELYNCMKKWLKK